MSDIRKSILKSVEKVNDSSRRKKDSNDLDMIEIGLHDPSIFVHTGSYGFNKIISGDYHKGFPMGKTMILAGEPSSGKSYLACSIIKNAQKQGILPVILDSESALDTGFLKGVGVSTEEEDLMYFGVATVAQCQNLISKTLAGLEAFAEEDRVPILFVVDSLGMLLTEKEQGEFKKGEFKADMGTKAKQLRLFFRMVTNAMPRFNCGMVATNHTYKGSDMYGNPTTSISGGDGLVYAASIIAMLKKKEMKDKVDKMKTNGIYVKTRCTKTRFCQPFQRIDLELPYKGGLNPYSGLLESFKEAGLISGSGWYTIEEGPDKGEKFQGEGKFPPFADSLLQLDPDLPTGDSIEDQAESISATAKEVLEKESAS